MHDIKIRAVQEKDAGRLADLMGQLGYPSSTEAMLKRIQLYLTNPSYFSYVAEKENNVIGSISVIIADYFHRPGRFARIVSMIVDENYRKQGVGKKIIEAAEKAIKKLDCDFIELTSGQHREEMGSHDFYFSLGYVDAKEKKKYIVKLI